MQRSVPILLSLLCACASTGSDSSSVHTVEAFREAKKAGRFDECREYLSDDPRIWWGEREGEGTPWELGIGRWKTWDDHFRGVTERSTDWHAEADRVWADMFETNDYFRLIQRGGGYWRATYFLAGDGKLAGFMVSSVPGVESERGRGDEFKAWAREHDPDETEYLMPGGSIDPTGDRAPRMRALLNEWRASIGLDPIL